MNNEYFAASRREIPISLDAGTVPAVGSGHAVWVSNVRGYSTGVALDLTVVISPKLSADLGVPYPVFGNDVPEDDGPGTIAVAAETSDHTYTAATGSLVCLGARASDLMALATYWIPGHPTSLVIRVDWPTANLAAALSLTTEGWGQAVGTITHLW
ncbi:hypothetical protein [Aeromicrobium sp.]|uniref:hypothetical protein n=1 Tax=Aeromicrobium sp. TaxID=1871063 RepID=UPI0019A036A3|nr:hypothetical protein [Aeromicrobium sp.]MBC7632975.1 hypothetical protein [Aeromicrobium sp.]